MAKKSFINKLQGTIVEEEKVVADRNIGIDKFSEADKIFQPEPIKVKKKIEKKKVGMLKTYYFHSDTVDLIKFVSDKLFDMKIKANYSDVIAVAVINLSKLKDEDLTKIVNEYLEDKIDKKNI